MNKLIVILLLVAALVGSPGPARAKSYIAYISDSPSASSVFWQEGRQSQTQKIQYFKLSALLGTLSTNRRLIKTEKLYLLRLENPQAEALRCIWARLPGGQTSQNGIARKKSRR